MLWIYNIFFNWESEALLFWNKELFLFFFQNEAVYKNYGFSQNDWTMESQKGDFIKMIIPLLYRGNPFCGKCLVIWKVYYSIFILDMLLVFLSISVTRRNFDFMKP